MNVTVLKIISGDFQYCSFIDDTKHSANILLLNMSFSKTIFSSNNLFSTAIYMISRIIVYIPNIFQIQVQLETSAYNFKYLQYKGFDSFSFGKRFLVHDYNMKFSWWRHSSFFITISYKIYNVNAYFESVHYFIEKFWFEFI